MINPLAKSVLILLGLTAAASAADAGIYKQILGSGTTTLIISNNEIEDIIKIVRSLEDCGLLLKGAVETTRNEVKARKGGFLNTLLGKLGAIVLGNMIVDKGITRAAYGSKGKGIVRAGSGSKRSLIKDL